MTCLSQQQKTNLTVYVSDYILGRRVFKWVWFTKVKLVLIVTLVFMLKKACLRHCCDSCQVARFGESKGDRMNVQVFTSKFSTHRIHFCLHILIFCNICQSPTVGSEMRHKNNGIFLLTCVNLFIGRENISEHIDCQGTLFCTCLYS